MFFKLLFSHHPKEEDEEQLKMEQNVEYGKKRKILIFSPF